jgi:hypothetical protein
MEFFNFALIFNKRKFVLCTHRSILKNISKLNIQDLYLKTELKKVTGHLIRRNQEK